MARVSAQIPGKARIDHLGSCVPPQAITALPGLSDQCLGSQKLGVGHTQLQPLTDKRGGFPRCCSPQGDKS